MNARIVGRSVIAGYPQVGMAKFEPVGAMPLTFQRALAAHIQGRPTGATAIAFGNVDGQSAVNLTVAGDTRTFLAHGDPETVTRALKIKEKDDGLEKERSGQQDGSATPEGASLRERRQEASGGLSRSTLPPHKGRRGKRRRE